MKERAARVRKAKDWNLAAGEKPVTRGVPAKAAAASRWVLTWKVADSRATVNGRLAAKGFQDPDL